MTDCEQDQDGTARKLSTNLYDIYHLILIHWLLNACQFTIRGVVCKPEINNSQRYRVYKIVLFEKRGNSYRNSKNAKNTRMQLLAQ